MKTPDRYYIRKHLAAIVSFVLMFGQQSKAQSYLNINFTNSTNKYSLITDVRSITFDESGGIVVTKTDNNVSTETLTLIKSITLDETDGGGTPLPVELVSFTALAGKSNAELAWRTATEVNNFGFAVERNLRDNGKLLIEKWKEIGFVKGNGTVYTSNEYSFSDKNLKRGTYSYRLKQMDRNGKFGYSDEIEVSVGDAPLEFGLSQNYPNPFNPVTTITFQLPNTGLTSLKVFDVVGREVATLVNEVKHAGIYSVSFDGGKLASGIYFSRLQNADKVQIKAMSLIK